MGLQYAFHTISNKICADGSQTTIVLHIDDLLVTNVRERYLDTFYSYLKGVDEETRIIRGKAPARIDLGADNHWTGTLPC